MLGHHGLYRGDGQAQVVYIDAEGITEDGRLMPFTEIEAGLAEDSNDDVG